MKTSEHISAEELSAYIDGDAQEPRAGEIQKHLDDCQSCSRAADELRVLRSDLSGLADAEPERNLWPAVQRASEPGVSWWRRFWMVPAAAVVGAAAALLVVLVLGRPVDDGKPPTGPLTALQTVAKAEVDYQNAVEALETAVKTSQLEWSPETRAVVEQGLAQMNETINKCRTALRKNRTDPESQEALLTAYQYKVDFLTDLVADSM